MYENAFALCSSLTELTLPESVTYIGSRAFQNCTGLSDITIPDRVKTIEDSAFSGCTGVNSVSLGKSIQLIGNGAFSNCTALSEIMIPNSVTAIERYAFYDCTDLAGVILGAGVKTVDMYAFCGCEKLSDIYYAGSSADWANIKITNTDNGNRSFLNAARHYDWLMSSVSGKDSFVTRLYEVCLGRKPSDEDRDGAVWQLENGTTGIQLAGNFIFSDEFAMKNYCDRHFVSALYRAFMGREPGEEEISNWVWRLQQGDRREDVFNEFAISSEFSGICSEAGIVRGDKIAVSGKGTRQGGYCSVAGCTSKDGICAFVKRLYTVCLDREADRNEIDAWHYNLVHGDYSATSAARFFLFSDEFKGHNYDDGAYVTHLYRAMLGREPDSSDLAYWVWELSANGMTRENAFERFAESDEFYLMCQTYGVIPQ